MICPLCERDVPSLEAHHLRTRRKDKEATEGLCRECHSQVHALFTNRELRDGRLGLDTIEGLREDERLARAIAYVAKQPVGAWVTTRQSNHARRKRR